MAEPQHAFLSDNDARIDDTHEIRVALTGDLDELAGPINKNHQGARRAFVRGVFSLIEAMTYRMKASALAIGKEMLDPAEVLLLEEREFTLEDSGALREKSPKLKTLPNLRFTLAMLVKASGCDWAPKYGGAGWAAVNAAIRTRDRLMHPRELKDVEVTDEQVQDAVRAMAWFTATQVKLFGSIHQKQAKDAGRPHVPLPGMDKISAMTDANAE